MENNVLISIWTNPDLTEEEKTLLSKEIAKELKAREKELEKEKIRARYENQAKETKQRIAQHNLDSRINEMVGILSHIEGKAGNIIYTKEELDKMDQFDLEQLFQGYSSRNPLALEKAREKYYQEREKEKPEDNKEVKSDNKEVKSDNKEVKSDNKEVKSDNKEEKAESESKTDEDVINWDDKGIDEEPSESEDKEKVEDKEQKNLDELSEKMTDDEMKYVLDIQKIAEEEKVDLLEAEKIYNERNKEETKEKPAEEDKKVKIDPQTASLVKNYGVKVKAKGIEDPAYIEKGPDADGNVMLRTDEEGRALISSNINDLELFNPKELEEIYLKEREKANKPESSFRKLSADNVKKVEDSLGKKLKVVNYPVVDTKPEPRKPVTRIVNRVKDIFQSARQKLKGLLDKARGKDGVYELEQNISERSQQAIIDKAPADNSVSELDTSIGKIDPKAMIDKAPDEVEAIEGNIKEKMASDEIIKPDGYNR